MNAKLVHDHSHDRRILADAVPLSAPLSLTVLASSICNLKCKYCVHDVGAPWLKQIQKKGYFLELETAEKMVDGLRARCDTGTPKLHRITYAGYGEPLLNPEIAEIVACTKKSGVTEEVVIVTNAVALTAELSDRLIEAGLDLLRVSIQGITEEEYMEQSGKKVNVDRLAQELRYYYSHKNNMQKIYVKIMDEQLKNEQEREAFLRIFGDCSDEIAFESLAPVLSQASAEDIIRFTKGINAESVGSMKLCPLPFYSLHVMTNGDIATCCYYDHAGILGNVRNQSIQDVWESEQYHAFIKNMLMKEKRGDAVCGGCKAYAYTMRSEDSIDDAKERLCAQWGV